MVKLRQTAEGDLDKTWIKYGQNLFWNSMKATL